MSENNQKRLYAVGSILRGVQDEVTSGLRSGRMIGDIAVEHGYTTLKCQNIYEGTYTPAKLKAKSGGSGFDGLGELLGKVAVGAVAFVVAGPVGMAVAGGASCMYETSVANVESDKAIKAVEAVAKKEENDKLVFASLLKKQAVDAREKRAENDRLRRALLEVQKECLELRAEKDLMRAQINGLMAIIKKEEL